MQKPNNFSWVFKIQVVLQQDRVGHRGRGRICPWKIAFAQACLLKRVSQIFFYLIDKWIFFEWHWSRGVRERETGKSNILPNGCHCWNNWVILEKYLLGWIVTSPVLLNEQPLIKVSINYVSTSFSLQSSEGCQVLKWWQRKTPAPSFNLYYSWLERQIAF